MSAEAIAGGEADPAAAPRRRGSGSYVAHVVRGWEAAAGDAGGAFAGTVFQGRTWLSAWYAALRTLPEVEPLVVVVSDGDGRLAALVPLVRFREAGRRVVEFADLGLTDYNAPLLGPAAPVDAAGAGALWAALARAVRPVDLVRLRKMPPELAGRPNPLAIAPGAAPGGANGNVVRVGEDYDAWRHTLVRHVRMDLERIWRVFSRRPGTGFALVTDPAKAHRVLAAMEEQQAARMREAGAEYRLDEPFAKAFYRALIDRGLAREASSDGVVLTALTAGEEVVAGCLGVRDGDTAVLVRLTAAAGEWSNCSPGRLVLERTLHLLQAEGVRTFDFSIGNQDYKRRFGIEPTPLVDLVRATGLRGLSGEGRALLAGRLRSYPVLDRAARRLLARFGGQGA